MPWASSARFLAWLVEVAHPDVVNQQDRPAEVVDLEVLRLNMPTTRSWFPVKMSLALNGLVTVPAGSRRHAS
jgi:hypothetical protein